MSKSWTPEELAAASAAMKAEGHMSYEEFCAAPVLRLEYRGRDSWDRPVYECDGRLYVDVDPRRSRPADICTKQGNGPYLRCLRHGGGAGRHDGGSAAADRMGYRLRAGELAHEAALLHRSVGA